MFKFALESNVVVLNNGTAKDDKTPSVEMTAEFSNLVNETILDSIIFSLTEAFEKTGLDQKSIHDKLRELINAMHVRQDVGESYVKWKERWDPTYDINHPYVGRIAPETNGYYEFFRIVDSISRECGVFTKFNGKNLSLNEREQELISRLEAAHMALQKARDEFCKYTAKYPIYGIVKTGFPITLLQCTPSPPSATSLLSPFVRKRTEEGSFSSGTISMMRCVATVVSFIIKVMGSPTFKVCVSTFFT